MMKWFLYIVLLMIFAPRLSSAEIFNGEHRAIPRNFLVLYLQRDTAAAARNGKHPADDDKKKIKEIAKARKMPKPEKVEDVPVDAAKQKAKPKRQRRPEGLERPPEIPRRNN